jgi:hypothetical protein
MPINTETPPEKPHSEFLRGDETPRSPTLCEAAFVERLPFALTYAANLEPPDRAVLFYDNLVVAAEYFCAFIEEGIRRKELTCLTGLDHTRYRALFEQVGIRVEELENCGYLRNLPSDDLYDQTEQLNGEGPRRNSDDPLRTSLEDAPKGIRFIHIQKPSDHSVNSLQDLIENERRTHKLFSFPTTSICCYDTKLVLEDTPSEFFNELLKAHDHCLFQGIAMPTSKLLALQRNAVYPKLRSA